MGSHRFRRLVERAGRGDAAGLRERSGGLRRMGGPQRRRRHPTGWIASIFVATWPRWGPAAWPAPPWPARRRPSGAISPGRCARAVSTLDPARSLRAPTGKGRLPRVLSEGEIGALLDRPGTSAIDQRDTGSARAALRRRPAGLGALRARSAWGRPAGRTVTVLGKGGKERRVPIHDRAALALRGWLARRAHGHARVPPKRSS